MPSKKNTSPFLTVLLALILLAASACSGTPTALPLAATSAPADLQPTATTPPAEPTTAPTPTTPPQSVVLVAPPGSDPAVVQEMQQALTALAEPSQMAVETVESLAPEGITPQMAVVVWLGAPGNLADLAAAAPQTVFVVASTTDVPAGEKTSVVRLRPEYQAFVGGYLAALMSPNWRAAGLLPGDGPLGDGLGSAFVNGGRYFCGVCAPGWPLGEKYPQAALLPAATDGAGWQAAAAGFFDVQKADVFYLTPEAARAEVIAFLQGKSQFDAPVRLLGTMEPPAELRAQWGATVRYDLAEALRGVWSDASAGKGGLTVEAPIRVDNVNPEHLGEGKMRLVRELLGEIAAGRIYPFTVPPE